MGQTVHLEGVTKEATMSTPTHTTSGHGRTLKITMIVLAIVIAVLLLYFAGSSGGGGGGGGY